MTSDPVESSVDANALPRRLMLVIGLVCIGFGIFRIVSLIAYVATNGVGRWWLVFSPPSTPWLNISLLVTYLILAILLLSGGVSLCRWRRAGRIMLISWATLDPLVHFGATVVSFVSYMQYLATRTSPGAPVTRPAIGIGLSMFATFIEHVPFPLAIFLILRLPQLKLLWLSETSRTSGFEVISVARVATSASPGGEGP
jgi:hypothetical protein